MRRTGIEKLRSCVNTHLQQLRNAPLSRQEQIRLCRQIVQDQDEIDARNAENRAFRPQRLRSGHLVNSLLIDLPRQ